MGGILTLPVKAEYFDAIRDGSKAEEYRKVTKFWAKRLEGRNYTAVVMTRGYPRRDDSERRLSRKWNGYTRKRITHPHFGPDPVEVYAIDVSEPTNEH